MSAPRDDESAKVALWCHVCRRFVEHHAAFVATGKGARVLHVTPAVLAPHRASHGGAA